ncbi:MAG: MarR family winged helix-turn-helix transcriptional regulator [Sulfitobacter sp.]|nr:MarR family winged helix-turn-helix transcriptional regulator [Sulfitobacter sp.]
MSGGPLLSKQEVDDFIIVRATALVSKVQRRLARDVLRREKLPVLEWRLIFCIARFGNCHLAYITQRTSIDPAHGSRAASSLEKKGLITRHDDPENRRRKVLSLTPDGIALFERIWPKARANVTRITDQLKSEDFAELKRLLDVANEVAEQGKGPKAVNSAKSDAA